MKRNTHVSVGLAFAAPLVIGNPLNMWCLIVTIIASFVPDWDINLMEHRTWTHSIIALVTTTTILLLINDKVAIFWFIGYASHLVLDSFTKLGVPFLYPFIEEKYGLKFCKTGGVTDLVIHYIAILLLIYFAYLNVTKVIGINLFNLLYLIN